jgi:hypothetical protein
MAVPPGAPAPRTRIKFEDLISFQPPQGTLQNQAVPPILTDDQVMSQAQMGMNYGDDELTSLLNTLKGNAVTAGQNASTAEGAWEGAMQAPMPQMQAPNISPLVAMGSLAAGNMASVLAGRPEWAQQAPNKLNAMQTESYRSALQARGENLDMLQAHYQSAREEAMRSKNLEESTRLTALIEKIYKTRENIQKGFEKQAADREQRAGDATRGNTQRDIAKFEADQAWARASLDFLSAQDKQTKPPTLEEWNKGWQDLMGQVQAETAAGKKVDDALPNIRARVMEMGFPPGQDFATDSQWLIKPIFKGSKPLFDLNNKDQTAIAFTMLQRAHPVEFKAWQDAIQAKKDAKAAAAVAYRAGFKSRMAATERAKEVSYSKAAGVYK